MIVYKSHDIKTLILIAVRDLLQQSSDRCSAPSHFLAKSRATSYDQYCYIALDPLRCLHAVFLADCAPR